MVFDLSAEIIVISIHYVINAARKIAMQPVNKSCLTQNFRRSTESLEKIDNITRLFFQEKAGDVHCEMYQATFIQNWIR